jgi:hypothetical protein
MIGPVFAQDDLDRIVAELDRSACFALLEQVAGPAVSEDDCGQVAYALEMLADPRSVAGLVVLGEDRSRPADVRWAALEVLTRSGLCPEGEALRRWWQSGDELLRERALIEAERAEADIVGPVARDPAHPLHAAAIRDLSSASRNPTGRTAR